MLGGPFFLADTVVSQRIPGPLLRVRFETLLSFISFRGRGGGRRVFPAFGGVEEPLVVEGRISDVDVPELGVGERVEALDEELAVPIGLDFDCFPNRR